jgi:hypothetical protein
LELRKREEEREKRLEETSPYLGIRDEEEEGRKEGEGKKKN